MMMGPGHGDRPPRPDRRRHRLAPSMVALACAVGVLALAGTGAAGTVSWSADMETGDLSQWLEADSGGVFNDGTGRVSATRTRARSGRYSMALSIRGADGRRPAQAARIFRWGTRTGAPLPISGWYEAWLLFPTRFTRLSWWNVFQWKSKVSADQVDPTFLLSVDNRGGPGGPMYLELWNALEARTAAASRVNIPVGRWIHIEAFYRWSTARTGRVVVFQDGRRILEVSGVRTALPSRDPSARQWSLANYTARIRPADATLYVDDAALGPGPPPPP